MLGKFYDLKIAREVDFGVYLESEKGDILLPAKYVPEGVQVGDSVRVFVHRDSEDRLLATTLEPTGQLNDMVALEVSHTTPHGAYMNWGLEKDLFVPKSEQPDTFREGEKRVVRICLDYKTDRLLGVGKINAFFDKDTSVLKEDQEVRLLVYGKSDLGFNVVINGRYSGLLYENEVFEPLAIGDSKTGCISKVREDGKVDVRLQPVGVGAIDGNSQRIVSFLENNGGTMPLTDKSDPSEIYEALQMSKKAFKKALGGLYKEHRVILHETYTELKG